MEFQTISRIGNGVVGSGEFVGGDEVVESAFEGFALDFNRSGEGELADDDVENVESGRGNEVVVTGVFDDTIRDHGKILLCKDCKELERQSSGMRLVRAHYELCEKSPWDCQSM